MSTQASARLTRAVLALSSPGPLDRALGGRQRGVLLAVAYFVTYVIGDAVSYVRPVLRLDITPWDPQTALTLAFLLVSGVRGLPVVALAAFTAEWLVHDLPAPGWALFGACVWIACGYTALAVILRRWGLPRPIDSAGMAIRFGAALMATSFVVALGYVALVVLGGALPKGLALGAVARYWVGDVIGVVTLLPLILHADRWRIGLRALRQHGMTMLLQLGTVALAMWIIFGLNQTEPVRFFYLLFVPVIWITLRWGVPGASLTTLAIQLGVILAVQIVADTPTLVDLQFLLLTLSLTALLLGAVVTERADALQRVAASEAEQRALLATAPDAVLTVSSRGLIRSANSEAQRLFGVERLPKNQRQIQALLSNVELHSSQGRAALEGRRVDGSAFPAEIAWARLETSATADYLVIIRDVTERQRAEARLRERERALGRAMRFAVAGQLASALAHELNQPITALVSYLQASELLAAPFASRDTRLSLTLDKAAHEAHRAAQVLHRLRDFYRNGAIKREHVQVAALFDALVIAFQERLQRCGASLVVKVPEDFPDFENDITQLEIVIHNLLANAIDAVCQQPIGCRRIELTAAHARNQITFRVEDSGQGVARDVAEKLFEPFVTNKVDGMGLGLAISRSLLRAQGGDLQCEPGGRWGGACFIVRLPLSLGE